MSRETVDVFPEAKVKSKYRCPRITFFVLLSNFRLSPDKR